MKKITSWLLILLGAVILLILYFFSTSGNNSVGLIMGIIALAILITGIVQLKKNYPGKKDKNALKKDKNKIGLIVGLFFAIVHAVWALMVAIIPSTLQSFLNWIFELHFILPIWILTAFNFVDALTLVIITFISGYIFGWVFAAVYNWFVKK